MHIFNPKGKPNFKLTENNDYAQIAIYRDGHITNISLNTDCRTT